MEFQQIFPGRVLARQAPLHQLLVVFHSTAPQPARDGPRVHHRVQSPNKVATETCPALYQKDKNRGGVTAVGSMEASSLSILLSCSRSPGPNSISQRQRHHQD